MAETFGEKMNRERNNPNRMKELEESEKKPTLKDKAKALKDKLVNSDEDMQKMTENRADVRNRKEQAIAANPSVSKFDELTNNATGLKNPVNNISIDQAMSGDTPAPAKTEGGSVLADLVGSGAVDDTFKSGMLGGAKDDKALTTEEKREAAGLGPENFNVGEKANGLNNTDGDASGASGSSNEDGLNPREQKAKDSAMKQWQIAQAVLDEQNPYKSGADYLQALWGKGAKGKAQAIGNVLGNLLGAVGKGAARQDYTSDWQKFRDEYTAQSQARRAEAAQNAQNMVNVAAQNDEARMELVNALNQAKAQGANITEKDLAAINAWQTATTPSSALNKAIAAVVNKVTSEGLLPAAGNILTGIGGR